MFKVLEKFQHFKIIFKQYIENNFKLDINLEKLLNLNFF